MENMRYVSQEQFGDAVKAFNRGDIVAVPTEAAYGLAVKLDNTSAIRKLLELSQRQLAGNKILTLLLADVDDIKKYAVINRKTMNMARHYFPGELTLVLPKRNAFKHPYFDHFETVGVHIPEHKYLLELVRRSGPLLITSITLKDKTTCRSSDDITHSLPTVDTVVEGVAGGSIPPTIIDWTEDEPVAVRQGGLLIVRYA